MPKQFDLAPVIETMENKGYEHAYILGNDEVAFYSETMAKNYSARHFDGKTPKKVTLKALQDKLAKANAPDDKGGKADKKEEGK